MVAGTHFVGTVVESDFLSEDEDVGVACHLLVHGGVECLSAGHLCAFAGIGVMRREPERASQ